MSGDGSLAWRRLWLNQANSNLHETEIFRHSLHHDLLCRHPKDMVSVNKFLVRFFDRRWQFQWLLVPVGMHTYLLIICQIAGIWCRLSSEMVLHLSNALHWGQSNMGHALRHPHFPLCLQTSLMHRQNRIRTCQDWLAPPDYRTSARATWGTGAGTPSSLFRDCSFTQGDTRRPDTSSWLSLELWGNCGTLESKKKLHCQFLPLDVGSIDFYNS